MTMNRAVRALIAAVVLATGAGMLATAGSATASTAPAKDAHVTIVHGVRGLVASVSLDGKQVLTSFAPRRSAGPLALAPGQHRVVVTTSAAHTPVLSADFTLTPGERVTAALGLNGAGKPHLYLYPDSLPGTASSAAALVMRDVADVPTLHAKVDGKNGGSLAAGHQLVHAVTVGRHTVSLVSPGTGKTVLAPRRIPVSSGAATALYLIGSASKQDLGWVATHVVPADSAPTAVHTGNSGLAAPTGPPLVPIVLVLLGIAGLGLTFALPRRRVAASAGR
jgi:hypothetical protein